MPQGRILTGHLIWSALPSTQCEFEGQGNRKQIMPIRVQYRQVSWIPSCSTLQFYTVYLSQLEILVVTKYRPRYISDTVLGSVTCMPSPKVNCAGQRDEKWSCHVLRPLCSGTVWNMFLFLGQVIWSPNFTVCHKFAFILSLKNDGENRKVIQLL